jgi:hypothetical protein
MLREKVHFRKFDLEPKEVFPTLRAYQPQYWPLDWFVVVSDKPLSEAKHWLKENATERFYANHTDSGCIIAFQSKTDSIKYQLFN